MRIDHISVNWTASTICPFLDNSDTLFLLALFLTWIKALISPCMGETGGRKEAAQRGFFSCTHKRIGHDHSAESQAFFTLLLQQQIANSERKLAGEDVFSEVLFLSEPLASRSSS